MLQAACWSKNMLSYLSPHCNHSSWINTAISDNYSSAEQAKKKMNEDCQTRGKNYSLTVVQRAGEKFGVVFLSCCSWAELDALPHKATRGFIFYTGKLSWFCWYLGLNGYKLSAVSEAQGHHSTLCSWSMIAFITWQFSFYIAADCFSFSWLSGQPLQYLLVALPKPKKQDFFLDLTEELHQHCSILACSHFQQRGW